MQGFRIIEPSLPMPTHPDCRGTHAPTPPVPITLRSTSQSFATRFISASRTSGLRPRSRAHCLSACPPTRRKEHLTTLARARTSRPSEMKRTRTTKRRAGSRTQQLCLLPCCATYSVRTGGDEAVTVLGEAGRKLMPGEPIQDLNWPRDCCFFAGLSCSLAAAVQQARPSKRRK